MPRRFVVLLSVLLALVAAFVAWSLSGVVKRPPQHPRQAPIALVDAARLPPGHIDYRRLDERLRRLAAEDEMVGLAVGVIEGGKINFLKGYGETVAHSGDKVTTSTVFRWASVSKGLAATMVAGLAEQGRLSLDDPIAKWAPSLKLPGGAERTATITDLLSHRLGIVANAYDLKLEEGEDARALRSSFGELPALCAPGTCTAYQNVAFDAASEIVERVTGLPYEAAVRARLFTPLGMNNASVSREGLMASKSWARPHAGKGKVLDVSDAYYRVPAAGGVNSSIYDFTLWMRAQMGGAPGVLSPKLLETIHRPRVATPVEERRMHRFGDRLRHSEYGLGWRSYDYLGHHVIGHHGGVKGNRSSILFDPALKTGVVALWNSTSSRPAAIEVEVMDMVYGAPFKDWLELDSRRGGGRASAAGDVEQEPGGERHHAEDRPGPGKRRSVRAVDRHHRH